jgi:hypothetical protein
MAYQTSGSGLRSIQLFPKLMQIEDCFDYAEAKIKRPSKPEVEKLANEIRQKRKSN